MLYRSFKFVYVLIIPIQIDPNRDNDSKWMIKVLGSKVFLNRIQYFGHTAKLSHDLKHNRESNDSVGFIDNASLIADDTLEDKNNHL